jgi:diguanylate cyclase (GGDEF)-like protein
VFASINLPNRRRWIHAAQLVSVACVVYFAADTVLNKYAFGEGWTILWPLNGITVALLLSRNRSDWAPILLGVAIGTGVGEYLYGNSLSSTILQRCFSIAEVLVTASLLPHFTTLEEWLRRPYLFLRFATALVLGPGISGVMAAILFQHDRQQTFWPAFNSWATADVLGIAATMPLVLSLRSREMGCLFGRTALQKTLLVLGVAFAAIVLIFSESRYPLLFVLYPVLLLVDLLLGFSGASIAVLGACLFSVYFTMHHQGSFAEWPHNLAISPNFALQLYLGFHMIALFPASIRSFERKRLESELRDANARLTMLASIDGLTGVANRRALDERFAQEWSRAMRVRTPLVLLMIDLDHFKQYNDLYGHHAGDLCLQSVSKVILSMARRPQDLAARFGGEEFVLILPQTTLEGARTIADQLREAIYDLEIEHRGSKWGRVTVSIGCASHTPARGENYPVLLELADTALYQAKQAGRNCVESSALAEQEVFEE